jgi:hypothetical protein
MKHQPGHHNPDDLPYPTHRQQKRLTFNKETILTPPTNLVQATTTETMASTLTQELLEESLNQICQDTEQKFILFQTKIHQEFVSMKDRIIAAVIKAVTLAHFGRHK